MRKFTSFVHKDHVIDQANGKEKPPHCWYCGSAYRRTGITSGVLEEWSCPKGEQHELPQKLSDVCREVIR